MYDRFNSLGFRSWQPAGPPKPNPPFELKLKPAVYTIRRNDDGLFFRENKVNNDEIIDLDDPVYRQVVADVEKFWTKDMKYNFDKYKMVYKRGILLYGKPGTGKTCTVKRVMDTVVERGGIVLFNPPPSLVPDAVELIRLVENRKHHVLVVMEELEGHLDRDECSLLTLLDGQEQVDDVVYIATTNYIDKIPNRIKRRPSRFCTVLEAGVPTAEARRKYILHKLHPEDRSRVDVNFWVDNTEGMTIDQLKDIVVQVLCFDIPVPDAVEAARSFDLD